MAREDSFITSRRAMLRGGALAGGLMLSPALTSSASAEEGRVVEAANEAGPVSYFLKLDGISGESQDATHQGWIEIESYGFQESNSTKSAAKKKGKVSLGPIIFTKHVDKSSPYLMRHCANGTHIKTGILTMRARDAKTDFMTFTLTNILVSKYAQSTAAGEAPGEHVSLNFTKVDVKYAG